MVHAKRKNGATEACTIFSFIGLFIQTHEEFFVVDGLGYAVLQELHGLNRCHVGEVVAECPNSCQGAFVDQEVVSTCARSHNVDGREDALVRQATVELELHVAGSLEFFEDDFIHLGTCVDESGGQNGQRATVFNLTGGTEETFGLLQGIGFNATSEHLARGRRNGVVSACQTGDGVE